MTGAAVRPQRLVGTFLETWLSPECLLAYARDHWMVVADIRTRFDLNAGWEPDVLSAQAKVVGACFQQLGGLSPCAAINNRAPARARAKHLWDHGFGLLALTTAREPWRDLHFVLSQQRHLLDVAESVILIGNGGEAGLESGSRRYDSEQLSLF